MTSDDTRKFTPSEEDFIQDEGWWTSILEDEDHHSAGISAPSLDEKHEGNLDSLEKAIDWDWISQMMKQEEVVYCQVQNFNRGGLLVETESFNGFIPISHLNDFPNLENTTDKDSCLKKYVGKDISVKVIECDPSRGRIVLSERAAQAAPGERHRLLSELKEGEQINGLVTNITDFGVFVDLGGVEGLVHISELSWGRVMHPSDHVEMCQNMEVVVITVDQKNCRVSLSKKRLTQNPWENILVSCPEGSFIGGKITQIVKYGAFVLLDNGLEGLVHVTEMSLDNQTSPADILVIGQRVDLEVISIDSERQRMSLRLL